VLDFHCGQTQHEPIVVLQRRVLIDSTAAVEAAWRAFAGWYALAAAELLEVADGWRSRDVVERFADRLPVPVGEGAGPAAGRRVPDGGAARCGHGDHR
jgi:hypothetical protein